MIFWWKPELR